jgi:hypothetical protein
MKSLALFGAAIVAGTLLTGCGDNAGSPPKPVNPADVNNPLVNAKRTADKTVDAAALNQAVQLFNVQEGRYPKDLQELVPKYVGKLPEAPLGYKLSYDAAKGEVSVVRQ